MAYSESNPPALIWQPLGGGVGKHWLYRSTDASTTVDAANYITNGGSLGISAGDVMHVVDTDATPAISKTHLVNATGDGTTDLNDETVYNSTDTD